MCYWHTYGLFWCKKLRGYARERGKRIPPLRVRSAEKIRARASESARSRRTNNGKKSYHVPKYATLAPRSPRIVGTTGHAQDDISCVVSNRWQRTRHDAHEGT